MKLFADLSLYHYLNCLFKQVLLFSTSHIQTFVFIRQIFSIFIEKLSSVSLVSVEALTKVKLSLINEKNEKQYFLNCLMVSKKSE